MAKMRYFITPEGLYYCGDSGAEGDFEVSARPSDDHAWSGSKWILDEEKVLGKVRAERDIRISEVIWMVDRHRQQKDLSMIPTLTDEQYILLLNYIQELRDFPAVCDINNPIFPEKPF